eukprot:1387306-Amorphochlora_amoeboformis.AAC.2
MQEDTGLPKTLQEAIGERRQRLRCLSHLSEQVIKKHKEAVEQKENKSKLNALLTAVPDHVKVVK